MSNEKRAPGCLLNIRDYTTQLCGDYNKPSHYNDKDPYTKQPGFNGKSGRFFLWLNLSLLPNNPPARKTKQQKLQKKKHQVDHTKPIAYTEFINKAIGDPAFDAIKPLSEIFFVASLRAVSGFSTMSFNAVAIVQ